MNSSVVLVFSRPRVPQAVAAFRQMVDRIVSSVAGVPSLIVPHLYDLSPGGPTFQLLRDLAVDMILLAPLFPRAAHLVLKANGLKYRLVKDVGDETAGNHGREGVRRLWAFDYRDYLSTDVLKEAVVSLLAELADRQPMNLPLPSAVGREGYLREIEETTRPRWYPVIDEERCESCYECVNFCLFGVFDVREDGRVFTAQPDACRPGCPACARVCPGGAIVFPLYPDPAIAGGNGGAAGGTSGVIAIDNLLSGPGGTRAEAERLRKQFTVRKSSVQGDSEPGRESQTWKLPEHRHPDSTSSAQPGPGNNLVDDNVIDRWLNEAEDNPSGTG